jgi:glycosyltransferase involved in cell wall biosynthesis
MRSRWRKGAPRAPGAAAVEGPGHSTGSTGDLPPPVVSPGEVATALPSTERRRGGVSGTIRRSRRLKSSTSGVWGRTDRVRLDQVRGWMYAPAGHVLPVLMVDGKPAELVAWPVRRDDVSRSLGTSDHTGFRFRLHGAREGALLELLALVGEHLEVVHVSRLRRGSLTTNPLEQLERAAELARDERSVAVTCWDGGHNPIGRAKVLYDIASRTRPTALFCYLFEEFGTGVWPPLTGTGTAVVAIPWHHRRQYHEAIRDLGIAFNTVWMCKPRLPTFLLAAQIASADARLVLDIDDNEEHFSMSEGSRKRIYGLPGLGHARLVAGQVPARTVASGALQLDFGGRLVRHARDPVTSPQRPRGDKAPASGEVKRVGFIGTVRPHKNVVTLAKSIGAVSWAADRDIRLHVMGDVAPRRLRDDLVANGAEVSGLVPIESVPDRLATMDCVVTGFPPQDVDEVMITRYQISAKIGDALAAGKPVLVPDSPSVRDLDGVAGVYLFDTSNFGERLIEAIDSSEPIRLPADFTIEGAAASFELALVDASGGARADEVLGPLRCDPSPGAPPPDTVLLVWKQHDAGLYGRRVDQVARSWKLANPDSRVVVLEFLHERDRGRLEELRGDATTDAAEILDLAAAKASSGFVDADGVEYRTLPLSGTERADGVLEQFLVGQRIFPRNTRVVLYPIIERFSDIAHVLRPYRTVVDVVDNQFAWATSAERRRDMAWQYSVMVRSCDALVFNSEANRDFFTSSGIVADELGGHVIPNWYQLPRLSSRPPVTTSARRSLVYSGNMNDRVDWKLLGRVCDEIPEARLVLIGTASRSLAELNDLLRRPNVVYLGALNERDCISALCTAQAAVVPHVVNDVSSYMNPLKLRMYEALRLPAVTSQLPGVGQDHSLLVQTTPDLFVDTVRQVLAHDPPRGQAVTTSCQELAPEARTYLDLLGAMEPAAGGIEVQRV